MRQLSDRDLLEEIRTRIEGKERARADLRETTRALEAVNARLLASEGLKSHFLANIRNEMNNPLTAVLGLAREIGACGDLGQCRELAAALAEEAFALDFQLRNILAAAEIEAGEASVRVARVDVRRVVEEAVASFAGLAAARQVRLDFGWLGAPEDAADFPTDPARLALVVANLVSNAVKFAPEDSEVAVAAYRAGGALVVRVEDAGSGVHPEHRELIFERFWQLESGPAKGWQGHGLGLAVVRATLEILGGAIEVGDRPGFGSVFTVRIPPSGAVAAESPRAAGGNELVFGEERF